MNMGDYISDAGREHLNEAYKLIQLAKVSMEEIRAEMKMADAWDEANEQQYQTLYSLFHCATHTTITLALLPFYKPDEK